MNLKNIREHFPSLHRTHNNNAIIYLDGPAGTQVPTEVIESISTYYKTSNANTHGHFLASQETDTMMSATRKNVATFLGAASGDCISFGQNMTTLNFSLSRALARNLHSGDEILITQLDHESNRGPWLALQEQGIIVKEINLLQSGLLDYDDLEQKVNVKTKIVCIGLASNILGTVNDIARIRSIIKEKDIMLVLDAVHYAPHLSIDVKDLDCDFLLCSAYKFYGPHVGILYSRPGLLDKLDTYRLSTQDPEAPYRIETGTLNHAAIAGVNAAVEFITSLGQSTDKRKQMEEAMVLIHDHEMSLFQQLYDGINSMPKAKLFGPPASSPLRTPTLSFSIENVRPEKVCSTLGDHGIYAWDGHFYAKRAVEILNLTPLGGLTRMGIVAYNTEVEVNRTLDILDRIG